MEWNNGRVSPEYKYKKISLNEIYTSFLISSGIKWWYAKEAYVYGCLDEEYERYT